MWSPRTILVGAAALGAALTADHAHADTLTVSASVASECSITAGTLDFGFYDPVDDVDGAGSFGVQCDGSADLAISLDPGQNDDGGSRRMTDGSEFLSYLLYSDTGRQDEWGNGSLFGAPHTVANDGTEQTIDVYGRLFGTGQRDAGEYSDTVQITFTVDGA